MRLKPAAADVVPCVALPAGAAHEFTYAIPPGLRVTVGALVQVPFGSRRVDGVVWRLKARARRRMKTIEHVVCPSLLLPGETAWLARLADVSLESRALLVKSLAAVRQRRPVMPASHDAPKRSRRSSVTVVWGQDILPHLKAVRSGQALVLVPELSLGHEILERCRESGLPAVLFAATLKRSARTAVLDALVAGTPRIVIATHSGIFLPFPRLSAIFIVEPALPSHRQWDLHPRYDARVAALLRARSVGVPLTLVASLPALDVSALAQSSAVTVRGRPLSLRVRVHPRSWDDPSVLLPEVVAEMRETLGQGEPVFLFHNVVGAERQYVCATCGWSARCTACGGILERRGDALTCRDCGTGGGPLRHFCPQCGSPRVSPRLVGTRALETFLKSLFPETSVLRVDRETVPRSRLVQLTRGTPALVIGTERIFASLKGVTFGMSVIVDADVLLARPDYDAAEQALRLIERVAALTESPHEQTVHVQTAFENFPLFRALADGNAGTWLRGELNDRRVLHYPPSGAMVRWTRHFSQLSRARGETERLVRDLRRGEALFAGVRIRRDRTGFRADVLARGAVAALSKVLPAVPRVWVSDPHVPLAALLS